MIRRSCVSKTTVRCHGFPPDAVLARRIRCGARAHPWVTAGPSCSVVMGFLVWLTCCAVGVCVRPTEDWNASLTTPAPPASCSAVGAAVVEAAATGAPRHTQPVETGAAAPRTPPRASESPPLQSRQSGAPTPPTPRAPPSPDAEPARAPASEALLAMVRDDFKAALPTGYVLRHARDSQPTLLQVADR